MIAITPCTASCQEPPNPLQGMGAARRRSWTQRGTVLQRRVSALRPAGLDPKPWRPQDYGSGPQRGRIFAAGNRRLAEPLPELPAPPPRKRCGAADKERPHVLDGGQTPRPQRRSRRSSSTAPTISIISGPSAARPFNRPNFAQIRVYALMPQRKAASLHEESRRTIVRRLVATR